MGWRNRYARGVLAVKAVYVRRLSLMLIGGFVGLLIVASSAEADALLFTDRAAWAAAAGTHRTFTQPDSNVYDTISQTVSLTFGGIGIGYDYVNIWSNDTG